MFQIKANPTFDATLTITGQGREQKLALTFRHMTRSEYLDLLQNIGEGKTKPADAVLDLVEKWEADMPLEAASVDLLEEHQPGASWAIITGYQDALTVARKGN